MIIVTGSVTASAETYDALRQICLAHVLRSRREPGCISHDVHSHCEEPHRLVFFERWSDMACLTTHFQQPGTSEFMRGVRGQAAASEAITVYQAEGIGVT